MTRRFLGGGIRTSEIIGYCVKMLRFMVLGLQGIRLRRDSWVSVRYAEGLHSSQSSATHQRTDRHEIVDQKPADFQHAL